MKRVLCMLAVAVVSSLSFSQSGYKRQAAWLDHNSSDTTTITVAERISYCIKTQCGKVLSGENLKSAFANNESFTVSQMTEFCKRGVLGSMYEPMKNFFAESNQLNVNGLNITDAQMNTIFYAKAWAIISLIGTQYM